MLKFLSIWIKRLILVLWGVSLVTILGYYFYDRESFSAVSLKHFLEQFGSALLLIYFLLSALRGFTLVPSTPFVLVGILLFPESLYFVYVISMVGILLSATMIYFFSRETGFEDALKKHHEKAILQCESWVKKYGFYAVAIWSFLIIVPTDVICYIAGILRMNYWKYILAVALGEGIICIILIFGGGTVVDMTKGIL